MRPPTALTIAGSDSGGGAGIQADLRAFAAVGVHGASAVTAITAQDTRQVASARAVDLDLLDTQLRTVLSDLDVRAAKTGMLHDAKVVEVVRRALDGRDVPLVVDPVLVATSGDSLAASDLREAIVALLPEAVLVTPNLDEAEALVGSPVRTEAEMEGAARRLVDLGAGAALVKGGHLAGGPAKDFFFDGTGPEWLVSPRVPGRFHGAGCTFSALATGLLARGVPVREAVREAKFRLVAAIERAFYPGADGSIGVLDPVGLAPALPASARAESVAVSLAARELSTFLPATLVPEVGINLAFAPSGAARVEDVVALDERVLVAGGRVVARGNAALGRSAHVARVALAAKAADPNVRAAMNLAYSPRAVRTLRALGLRVASFARADEPAGVSSMEWGTRAAIREGGAVPDAVFDEGGPGKEPMIRLLGRDPADVVAKARRLAERLGDPR
ncbi:MAG: bifunctional hydroxymethylpyrimidine kinase/phosphomethylpyrimidine kinase [Methanobacteriota archaeon]